MVRQMAADWTRGERVALKDRRRDMPPALVAEAKTRPGGGGGFMRSSVTTNLTMLCLPRRSAARGGSTTRARSWATSCQTRISGQQWTKVSCLLGGVAGDETGLALNGDGADDVEGYYTSARIVGFAMIPAEKSVLFVRSVDLLQLQESTTGDPARRTDTNPPGAGRLQKRAPRPRTRRHDCNQIRPRGLLELPAVKAVSSSEGPGAAIRRGYPTGHRQETAAARNLTLLHPGALTGRRRCATGSWLAPVDGWPAPLTNRSERFIHRTGTPATVSLQIPPTGAPPPNAPSHDVPADGAQPG